MRVDDNDASTPMKGAADNAFHRSYTTGLLTELCRDRPLQNIIQVPLAAA